MTSVDLTVKEFLETWARRRSGALPAVDLTVECSSCGIRIIGDMRVGFTKESLVCESCLEKQLQLHCNRDEGLLKKTQAADGQKEE